MLRRPPFTLLSATLLLVGASIAAQAQGRRANGTPTSGKAPIASGRLLPPLVPTLLRNATVIDVKAGRALPGQSILLRDGRIEAVGAASALQPPAGVRVIDLGGQYVIPGLIDSHVHMTKLTRDGARAALSASTWEYWSAMHVAHGVTGARLLGGDLAALRPYRDSVRAGQLLGPRMWITGAKLGEQAVTPGAPFPLTSPEAAVRSLQLLADGGADLVKMGWQLPRDQWLAVAREARRRGLAIESHVPRGLTLEEAADSGLGNVSHLFELDLATSSKRAWLHAIGESGSLPRRIEYAGRLLRILGRERPIAERARESYAPERARALYAHLSARGTFYTPTLALHVEIDRGEPASPPDERRRFSPGVDEFKRLEHRKTTPTTAAERTRFAFHLQLVREMHAAGVPLLAGSDAPTLNPVGYGLHDELALMVRAGLTPAEALRAATTNAARYMKTESLGTIRAGALADLVVLRRDPLQDIAATREIAFVVTAGRVLDRAMLATLRERAADFAAKYRADEGWRLTAVSP